MKFNLIQWLFTDPCSAGGGPASGNADCPNPGAIPLLRALAGVLHRLPRDLGLLPDRGAPQLFSGHAVNKRIFDNMLNNFAVIGLVGLFIIFFRWAADSSLFAWRFWRYAWLVWLAAITIRWGIYFIFQAIRMIWKAIGTTGPIRSTCRSPRRNAPHARAPASAPPQSARRCYAERADPSYEGAARFL